MGARFRMAGFADDREQERRADEGDQQAHDVEPGNAAVRDQREHRAAQEGAGDTAGGRAEAPPGNSPGTTRLAAKPMIAPRTIQLMMPMSFPSVECTVAT